MKSNSPLDNRGSPMKDVLLLGGLTLAIVLSTAGIVLVTRTPKPVDPICDTSLKALVGDPEFYTGKRIRLTSDGFEFKGNQLVYRKVADTPPVITCFFNTQLTGQRVKFVGDVRGVENGCLVVVNCTVVKLD